MTAFLCSACGVQYPPSEHPPSSCPICEDFRQYVPPGGQQWTTLDRLRNQHGNRIEDLGAGIKSIHTEPKFAIGQRSLLVPSAKGNVLWDCISLLDDAAIRTIQERGGISAIAISHPHYYSTMIEWSEAFGNVPVFIHEDDREWVMRPDSRVRFWQGETFALKDELTLIRCGGHFEGAQVLHHRGGALFTGDVVQVVSDRRWVSFMRSYPNYIPLPAQAVQRITEALAPFAFDRVYGAFPGFEVLEDAKGAVTRSADRYIRALSEVLSGPPRGG
jgi:glyoxylase-like metal-dependent hydrolase (beta-lactamase superfamily II)